jgi:urease accessory protein
LEGKIITENWIIGVPTGRCPHAAIREDPSINLAVIQEVTETHPELDILLLRAGEDNITTTFSPALADYLILLLTWDVR